MTNPLRAIPLQGASNFRDLGGYVGHEGRPVRWRKMFRSDQLGSLTAVDAGLLSGLGGFDRSGGLDGLGIGRVFDFRGQQERLAAPCTLPGAQVHSLSIEPSVVQRIGEHLAAGSPLTKAQMVTYMQQTYRDFVVYDTPRFAELFVHLLASDAPLVFHCTAGKDRTGFAAALILLALGVSREDVMEDYLLTNQLLKRPPFQGSVLLPEVRAVLEGVQADFLEAALHSVKREHGGLESYFTNGLGLGTAERARLAASYLAS